MPAEPAMAGNTHPVNILEAIAARGTAGNAIEDPAAWQQEVRQDRNLPFRD